MSMDVRFHPEHTWARLEDDGTATVGISGFAQEQLGDVVYVQLPKVGRQVRQGEAVAVVESVKSASDVHMPLSGEVLACNDTLRDAPETVNAEPLGAGWFLRLKPAAPAEFDGLMDASAYARHVAGAG
jgi:glycine cleavage system H protein